LSLFLFISPNLCAFVCLSLNVYVFSHSSPSPYLPLGTLLYFSQLSSFSIFLLPVCPCTCIFSISLALSPLSLHEEPVLKTYIYLSNLYIFTISSYLLLLFCFYDTLFLCIYIIYIHIYLSLSLLSLSLLSLSLFSLSLLSLSLLSLSLLSLSLLSLSLLSLSLLSLSLLSLSLLSLSFLSLYLVSLSLLPESFYPSNCSVSVSLCLSVFLFICLSVFLSLHFFIPLPINVSKVSLLLKTNCAFVS
jgi:hypothetical protein